MSEPPRPLNPAERNALLQLLNYADFEGRDALLEQADAVQVVGRCGCGCATVELAVDAPPSAASIPSPIPNEATVLGKDRQAIGGLLVFVKDGRLSELEVFSLGNDPIRTFPPSERLKLERVSGAGGPALHYSGRELVKFRDHDFRWIDLKFFDLPDGVGSTEEALGMLFHDARYRDHYTAAYSHHRDSENLHGPYQLDRISPASFEEIDEGQALETISNFVTTHGAATDETMREVQERVYPIIREGSARYRLRDLGAAAQHDFGWVLQYFTELVLVDVPSRRLVLMVAAQD